MLERLVRKLESVSALTDAEKQAVRGWFTATRRVAAGDDIVREGEAPQAICLLIEGLACRYRALSDGRRQIMAFLIPGDLVDLHGLIMGEMDHSVSALNNRRGARRGFLPRGLCDTCPRIVEARPSEARDGQVSHNPKHKQPLGGASGSGRRLPRPAHCIKAPINGQVGGAGVGA